MPPISIGKYTQSKNYGNNHFIIGLADRNNLFGGIYDNRFLVKITHTNKKYNMAEQLPYEGAKPMYLIGDVDNKEVLKEIFSLTI